MYSVYIQTHKYLKYHKSYRCNNNKIIYLHYLIISTIYPSKDITFKRNRIIRLCTQTRA